MRAFQILVEGSSSSWEQRSRRGCFGAASAGMALQHLTPWGPLTWPSRPPVLFLSEKCFRPWEDLGAMELAGEMGLFRAPPGSGQTPGPSRSSVQDRGQQGDSRQLSRDF